MISCYFYSAQSGFENFNVPLGDVSGHLPYRTDYGNEGWYCSVIFTATAKTVTIRIFQLEETVTVLYLYVFSLVNNKTNEMTKQSYIWRPYCTQKCVEWFTFIFMLQIILQRIESNCLSATQIPKYIKTVSSTAEMKSKLIPRDFRHTSTSVVYCGAMRYLYVQLFQWFEAAVFASVITVSLRCCLNCQGINKGMICTEMCLGCCDIPGWNKVMGI